MATSTQQQFNTINQGFDGHPKNTDDETLDLNQGSDRVTRNSNPANPNGQTLLATIDPNEKNQIEFGQDGSPNKEKTRST